MILTIIQSVVSNLSIPCAFIYGNLFEANGDLGISELTQEEGKNTFFIYIPPLENTDDTEETPLIHTIFPLQFFLMRKLNLTTIDYKSKDVEPTIDEMRELSREFIHSLNEEDIIEKGNTVNGKVRDGIDSWKITSEYAFFDHHLFGVSVTCDVPIMEGKTGCR